MAKQSWYAIHTKPHKEPQVRSYLESQGLEVFYPCIKVNPVNPRSSAIKPFFPCYLFVCADLEQIGTSAMHWIPGTIGLVEFDGTPASVPTAIINEIKTKSLNSYLRRKRTEYYGIHPTGSDFVQPIRRKQRGIRPIEIKSPFEEYAIGRDRTRRQLQTRRIHSCYKRAIKRV